MAHENCRKLLAQNAVKNHAYNLIVESLPARMKKTLLNSDGNAVSDEAGDHAWTVRDRHHPRFDHLGDCRYALVVPGIDDATRRVLAARLARFGDAIMLRDSAPEASP